MFNPFAFQYTPFQQGYVGVSDPNAKPFNPFEFRPQPFEGQELAPGTDVNNPFSGLMGGGSGAGEPGGLERELGPTATDYTNLDSPFGMALGYGKHLPGPLGLGASFAGAGIRGANAARADSQLEGAGYTNGLTTLQQIGALMGFNDYGEGSWGGNLAASAAAQRGARAGEQGFNSLSGSGGSYRTSPSGPTSNLSRGGARRDRNGNGGNGRSSDLGSGGRHGAL